MFGKKPNPPVPEPKPFKTEHPVFEPKPVEPEPFEPQPPVVKEKPKVPAGPQNVTRDAPPDVTFKVNPVVETAFETYLLKVKALADKIQALTAAGPGKATQAQLDALHADAQRLLTLKVKAPQK